MINSIEKISGFPGTETIPSAPKSGTGPNAGTGVEQATKPEATAEKPGGVADESSKINVSQLKEIVGKMNDTMGALSYNIKFSIDNKTNHVITEIVDGENHKTVKQLPPESLLNFVSKMKEMIGLLVDKEV